MIKSVSIIIPTYNMERYLDKCLSSLIIPELDRVEVIIVNDGSTDKSLSIAKKYENQYPQNFRIIDKSNGNYGSCINAALPVISGKYVKVLDADDSFDKVLFSRYVGSLTDCEEDIILTGLKFVTEEGRHWPGSQFLDDIKTGSRINFEEVASKIKYLSMHMVTYRSAIFQGIGYTQSEGVSFSDYEWLTIPMQYVSTVRNLGLDSMYHYLVGRAGQTTNPKLFGKQASNYITVFSKIVSELSKISSPTANRSFALDICSINLANVYRWTLDLSDPATTKKLASFDGWLCSVNEEIYRRLGKEPYYIAFRKPIFRFINSFRKAGRESNYSIPGWVHMSQKVYNRYVKCRKKLLGILKK